MTRTTIPTFARTGAALVGAAGLVVLAGCSGTENGAGTSTPEESAGGNYVDGTYTAEGSYQTPETVESVSVTLTLADGVVTDVEVVGEPEARESKQYQGQFIGGITEEVVGVAIDELDVTRVAGSSLTSGGFNNAVNAIKEQASA